MYTHVFLWVVPGILVIGPLDNEPAPNIPRISSKIVLTFYKQTWKGFTTDLLRPFHRVKWSPFCKASNHSRFHRQRNLHTFGKIVIFEWWVRKNKFIREITKRYLVLIGAEFNGWSAIAVLSKDRHWQKQHRKHWRRWWWLRGNWKEGGTEYPTVPSQKHQEFISCTEYVFVMAPGQRHHVSAQWNLKWSLNIV